MDIVGIGLTDIGRKRQHNEDAFLCDVPDGLFIVADGMGGRAAGELASKAVITVFPMMFKKKMKSSDNLSPGSITYILGETLCELSQHLYHEAQTIPEITGLGSTAALLFIQNDLAYIACAGDSRVYLLRKQQLSQISKDQTIAAALVRDGHLSPEKADSHPLSNSLEEYIGKEEVLHPGVWFKRLKVGDRWLLCSDGLTKGITDQELHSLLLLNDPPENICQILLSKAKENDGTDNITAIVVDIVEQKEH